MLLSNGTQYWGGPLRLQSSGTTLIGSVSNERGVWNQDGSNQNEFLGEAAVAGQSDKSSRPSGNLHPVTWKLPQKAGALSSRYEINGSSDLTGSGALGKNATVSIEGIGTLTGTGGLVVSGSVSMTGLGTLTGDILAALQAAADLQGTSAFTGTISAKGFITVTLEGDGTLTATSYATGNLECEITPFTELSPQNLANAVWTEIIESGYSAQEVMRLIAAVTAGKSSGGPGNPVFRDLGDTKDRVSGVATSQGDRTAVTYDVSE